MTSYPTALRLAHFWKDVLEPHCTQIEIAGSVRRQKRNVKDIELVCIPKPNMVQLGLFGSDVTTTTSLDDVLALFAVHGTIQKSAPVGSGDHTAWGPRYKRFYVSPTHGGRVGSTTIPVDLFIVLPPAQWGAQFVIRTGPAEFNQALMLYIDRRTPFRQQDGTLWRDDTPIATPDEASYFAALGLPVPRPTERSAAWVLKHTAPSSHQSMVD